MRVSLGYVGGQEEVRGFFYSSARQDEAAAIATVEPLALVGLCELAALAQRQLDWTLGANPFGMSFVVHVGRANPPEYVFDGFKPLTPLTPGAAMLGRYAQSDTVFAQKPLARSHKSATLAQELERGCGP